MDDDSQPNQGPSRHRTLTPGQNVIWAGQRMQPGCPLYNMAFAVVLDGPIDRDAFARAWQRVVDSSDAMRTRIESVDGTPIARIAAPGHAPCDSIDLDGRPDPAAEFLRWSEERAALALSPEARLVDSVLVDLGDGRHGWYFNHHHLINDAASARLMYQAMGEAYVDILEGRADRAASARSFYDTCAAQLEAVSGEDRALAAAHVDSRHRDFDRRPRLYGADAIPTTSRSRRITLDLGPDAFRRLETIATQSGFASFTPAMSRFAVLATALSAWLHRVSGSTEVGFDALMQCRSGPEARASLGLFMEPFPFGAGIEPGDTFRTLGARCLAESVQLVRHALPGASAPAMATVGNVVLNYCPFSFGDFAGIPASVEWVHSGHADSVHAVRMQAHEFAGPGHLTVHLDLNEDIFPGARGERAALHFTKLFEALLDEPDTLVSAVDLPDEAERRALLEAFNAGRGHPGPRRTVIGHLEAQVAARPDAVALEDRDRALDYRQLWAKVEAAAVALAVAGVRPGDRVLVRLPRTVDTVVAILAVLRARAVFMPVSPAEPAARLERVLERSAAGFAIVDAAAAAALDAYPVHTIDIAGLMEATPGADPGPGPTLDEPAYVIHTSGSTGTPKGIPIGHEGLSDYLEWAAREYTRGEAMRFALFTSLSVDLTVTSLFLPLVTGGTIVVYEETDGPVDGALLDVVDDNRVDFLKLTPSHLSLLRRMSLSHWRVRRLVVGGEDFKSALAAEIHAKAGAEIEIYNEYGPTEAVVGCMIHRFDPHADTGTSVPIGRPADHVQLYVLTESLSPVPEGVPGELAISRLGLTPGYDGLPDVNERQFVPHPFRPDDRLYLTGDRVRFRDRQTLEYLGRVDRQLKISGVRIEPGEIESALDAHPRIEGSVVVAYGDEVSPSTQPGSAASCAECGLSSEYPGTVLDEHGVCQFCREFREVAPAAAAYFKSPEDLAALFESARENVDGDYDCMLLLSGGKDSTYALCRLVDMGLRVYAYTLDNGFLSPQAMGNIARVAADLGVPHEFGRTEAMNAIFRDSLARFSNVCNGCFKAIYTLGLARARELRIPIIVTGLSRGQLFETRLSGRLFRKAGHSAEEIDRAVLAARKAYHRVDDEVARSLDVSHLADERIFDEIRFVDFYRYVQVELTEMLDYLRRRVPWVRPSDTGRSTNCLINDVGIYVHRKERGFHNYALPYSWDVRMGHKTRDQATDELNDAIDVSRVRDILEQIGYAETDGAGRGGGARLAAYYVSASPIDDAELRRHLASRLPSRLLPHRFARLDALPLSPSGKIDHRRLPPLGAAPESAAADLVAPEGPVQERIAEIWLEVLDLDRVGARTGFFELGGASLDAMEVMLTVCADFDVELPLQTLFEAQTIEALAERVENRIMDEVASLSEEEAAELLGDDSSPGTSPGG